MNNMKENPVIKKLGALLTEKLHIDFRKNPVHLKMDGDAIVMDGTVEKIAHKKRALLLAMGMEGTSGVIDRLRVRPSKHMTDREIYNHLVHAINGEPALVGADIKVEVKDGAADIEGTVGSLSAKRLAGVLAWWVPGTADVINSLEVLPPEEDSPDEINDALRIVFEKDSLVDASSIKVSTNGWVVTLSGTVKSHSGKEAAEDDAWYVWGVNDVVNNIQAAGPPTGHAGPPA
ncbi:MAG: BON domain-containing protein [Deltaproteobacteria bacterium]|nr:BON domain-containing protein [Deltaproteobacteria bacterium]